MCDDADGDSSGGSGAASGNKKDASPEKVVAISLPWRDNVPGLELGVAMLVNGFMIAGAVMDFSVDTYVAEERDADGLYKKERLEFLLTFLNWRGNAFILSEVMMVLILFLPVALFGMVKNFLAVVLKWNKASTIRNIADVMQLVTLACVILPLVTLHIFPAAKMVQQECTAGSSKECTAAVDVLRRNHCISCWLNVAMLVYDAAKYYGNVYNDDQSEKAKTT